MGPTFNSSTELREDTSQQEVLSGPYSQVDPAAHTGSGHLQEATKGTKVHFM